MDTSSIEANLYADLDRILASLTRLGAPVAGQLRPGLTENAIEDAFKRLPFAPARELRALYAWRDGTAGVEAFFPNYVFCSLDDAIADYQSRRDVAKAYASDDLTEDALWHPHWFPIFRASWGTEYAMLCPKVETATAPMLEIDVEGDSHDEEFTSLTHMMRMMADCFEMGAFTLHPGGYLEEDEAAVGDIRRAHDPTRADMALATLRQGATGPALNRAINDAIGLHDTRAIEALLALLREGDPGIRRAVILPLGMLGDERAIAPLLEIVTHGRAMRSPFRGNNLTYALHLMDDRGRMESFARAQAIDALERIAARTGLPLPPEPFLAAMNDPEPMVRQRAARRLGAHGDARAIPALLAALEDHNPQACHAAIEALGQVGDARALRRLRRFMGSQNAALSRAAEETIARIESRQAN